MHDLDHLGADLTNFRALGVGRLFDLIGRALCEANDEKTKVVAVGRLNSCVGLDQRVPLLDNGADLVACERHAVEVSEAVAALDIFTDETELAEVHLALVQIAKRHFEHAALEEVACNACKLTEICVCMNSNAQDTYEFLVCG